MAVLAATASNAGAGPTTAGAFSSTSDARSASTYARRDRHGGCAALCSHATRTKSARSAKASKGTNFGRSAGIWSAANTVTETAFFTEAFFFAATRSSPTSATATAGGNPCARSTRSVSVAEFEGSAGDASDDASPPRA